MAYRIAAFRAQNYKRVRDVEVKPEADQHLVMIAGNNGSGKSSTLDALTRLLGGKREQAADPVHHGASKSVITAVLEDGKEHRLNLVLEIKPDGKSDLSITDEHGTPLKSPQTLLDKIINGRALDPLAFTQLPAKEQRTTLLTLIDKKGEIREIDVKRERVFDSRTEVGRKEEHAKGELKRLPDRSEVQPEIDPSALAGERGKLSEIQRHGETLSSAFQLAESAERQARAALEESAALINRLRAELAAAEAKQPPLIEAAAKTREAAALALKELDAARADWRDTHSKRAAAIDADLARATAHNRAQAEAVIANRRRDEAEKVVADLAEQYEHQTKLIAKFDQRKIEILKAAKLPVEGLSVDDSGILLNGAPFSQASSAEQLRVALALAIEAQPQLRDVWIKDASLLDNYSLQLVSEYAIEKDRTIWMEVVGAGQEGAIVISEGLSEGKVAP